MGHGLCGLNGETRFFLLFSIRYEGVGDSPTLQGMKSMAQAGKRGFGATIGQEVLDAVGEAGADGEALRNQLTHRSASLGKMGSNKDFKQNEWVDPALCKPSPVNARDYDALTYEDCETLINTIKSEGRQRVPAVVRPTGDPDRPYEIVAGLRRHWSISWLRANNYPDYKYLINVEKMEDEAAFRFSDLENRARADITDLERGRSYRDALEKYYGGSQENMADRIGQSRRTLSRLIQLAELDPRFIEAIGGYRAVKVVHGEELRKAAKTPEHLENMLVEADQIALEQAERRNGGSDLIPSFVVVKRLVKAAAAKRPPDHHKAVQLRAASGKPMLEYVVGTTRTAATIKVLPKSDASRDEVRAAVLALIEEICDVKKL